MLIGGVIGYKIENHFQAAAMRLGEQAIEIRHGAEDGIDAAVIGHVIAEIRHGRRIDGRNPDRVHAQLHQVVERVRMPFRSPMPSPLLS